MGPDDLNLCKGGDLIAFSQTEILLLDTLNSFNELFIQN